MYRGSLGCVAIFALGSCSLFFGSDEPDAIPVDAATVPPPPDAISVIDADIPSIPSMPFPPTTDVNLVDGAFGDVNGDGIDDLLLATAPTGGADNGVYVLLGPQTGPDLVFHHFVSTGHPPISITMSTGALGMDVGASTLLVAGRESNAAVEAYVYDSSVPGYGPALIETSTSGSNPTDLVIGDFDRNGVAGDVIMAALRGLHQFYRWLPDGSAPPEATAENLPDDILALGTLAAALDDELVIALDKPRMIWRYYNESTGTRLGSVTTIDGSCGALSFARIAQHVDPTDELMDIVATSAIRLCGYRLEISPTGIKSIKEFHHPFDNPSVHLLPAPAGGEFEDVVTVNLNTVPEPEIVLLDTFNSLPTTITLVRDADALAGGQPGVLGATSMTSIDLASMLTPAFLLAPDFNNDGTSEIWAIDLRARDIACLRMSENDLVPCL